LKTSQCVRLAATCAFVGSQPGRVIAGSYFKAVSDCFAAGHVASRSALREPSARKILELLLCVICRLIVTIQECRNTAEWESRKFLELFLKKTLAGAIMSLLAQSRKSPYVQDERL